MTSRITAISFSQSKPLNVSGQWILHGPPGFERRQNRVEVDGCASIDLVAERVGDRVQNRGAATTNGRLADATSAHRRFGIWNVKRGPLHVDRNVEDGGRLGVIEAARDGVSVMGIEDPLLPDGVTDAED